MITIKKGLDLPIAGQLSGKPAIQDGPAVQRVALLGEEYLGSRPVVQVCEGEHVKKGQVLFLDKQLGVPHTAPAAGTIVAINRGSRRVLQSIVIRVTGNEQVMFPVYPAEQLTELSPQIVRDNLVASGLWTALRTRPFSHTPTVDSQSAAIFVTAIDTNPLAARPDLIIQHHAEAFLQGITLLTRLTVGKIYVCKAVDATLPSLDGWHDGLRLDRRQVVLSNFSGVHPAGLVGTHIHFLEPVSLRKQVWHIGYQDVIAFGKLFTTGKLFTDRIIALCGPQVKQPRLLRTRLGASLEDLTAEQLKSGDNRIISGSVLHGTLASGPHAFLGRFHQQVSVLLEGRQQQLFGWLRPGGAKFSLTRTTFSHFSQPGSVNLTTAQHGDARAMVPIGTYERIMPLDILPTLLLRDLIVGDSDSAQALGCLELDEEDLALCTFVCPGKTAYGPLLRQILNKIEKEWQG